MTCKGICEKEEYLAIKPIGIGRYASGQKRCQICEKFLTYEGLWCPCCGCRLRGKPRNIKFKALLRKRNGQTRLENDGIKNIKEIIDNGDGTITVQDVVT